MTHTIHPSHQVIQPQATTERRATRPAHAMPGTLLITSEQLFAGAAEVQIEHRGARYRLKQTSLGKLIMTK